jgi:hypothetical protein
MSTHNLLNVSHNNSNFNERIPTAVILLKFHRIMILISKSFVKYMTFVSSKFGKKFQWFTYYFKFTNLFQAAFNKLESLDHKRVAFPIFMGLRFLTAVLNLDVSTNSRTYYFKFGVINLLLQIYIIHLGQVTNCILVIL